MTRVGVADLERVIAEALTSLVGQNYDADVTHVEFLMNGADLMLKIRRAPQSWSDDT